jgi:hypothetical protein
VAKAKLACNGSGSGVFPVSVFRILGTSGASRVFVQRSDVSIVLSNVVLTGLSPFSISESSVTILLEGENSLTNAGTYSTGVECAELSNVTFTAALGGSLTVEAGTSGFQRVMGHI